MLRSGTQIKKTIKINEEHHKYGTPCTENIDGVGATTLLQLMGQLIVDRAALYQNLALPVALIKLHDILSYFLH